MASGGEDEAAAASMLVSMGDGSAVGGSTRTRRTRRTRRTTDRYGEEADEAAIAAAVEEDEAEAEEAPILSKCATCRAYKLVPRNHAPGWSCQDYDLECDGVNDEEADEVLVDEALAADDSEDDATAEAGCPRRRDFEIGTSGIKLSCAFSYVPVVQHGDPAGDAKQEVYKAPKGHCNAVGCPKAPINGGPGFCYICKGL